MDGKFIIGIDLGGTNLKLALLDFKYRIRDKRILNTQRFRNPEELTAVIPDSIKEITEANAVSRQDILGVGLGVPGPTDEKKGIAHFFPNIPGWREVRLKKLLEKKLRLPVFLDNDAKLMAQAEYRLGYASGFKNVLCLTLGTGIGAGIILEGRLYRGQDNAAGELGHMPINEDGPRCNCGSLACLEAYIGNSRIIGEAKKIFKRDIPLEELSALARKQDKDALNIWINTGRRLGIALSGVINLLNLDAIIIGGGVAKAGSVLFDEVRKTIKGRAMSLQAGRVKVFRAKLGTDAGLIGAAMLVKDALRIEK